MLFEQRLNNALRLVVESIRSDFFDCYLLSSCPDVISDQEGRALFIDRTDNLYEAILRKIYLALILRAEYTGGFAPRYGVGTYEDATKVRDPRIMASIVKKINDLENSLWEQEQAMFDQGLTYADFEARGFEGGGGGFAGNWQEIVIAFLEMALRQPRDAYQKLLTLDKFFGMAHNNGSIVDYLDLPWLFDALYTRALADPSELAQQASYDVQHITRLSRNLSFKPVTDSQKLALYKAKQERYPDKELAPALSKAPEWLDADEDSDEY